MTRVYMSVIAKCSAIGKAIHRPIRTLGTLEDSTSCIAEKKELEETVHIREHVATTDDVEGRVVLHSRDRFSFGDE